MQLLTDLGRLLILALATSALSITLTKSSMFEPARELIKRWPVLYKLATCPYCTSHWIALVIVIHEPLRAGYGGAIIDVFAVVGLSAILAGLAIKLLHLDQHEAAKLQNALAEAEVERDHYRQVLEDLAR